MTDADIDRIARRMIFIMSQERGRIEDDQFKVGNKPLAQLKREAKEQMKADK